MSKRFFGLLVAAALALIAVASASAGHQQTSMQQTSLRADDMFTKANGTDPPHHGPTAGHLPPSNANVDLVSRLQLSGMVPGAVADVATYRDTAYLGGWAPLCETRGAGGFWSVDISNPRRPRELAYVSAPQGSYQTEGVHAMRLTTPSFRGDVLIVSNEICADRPTAVGGVSIYDVTDPANPRPLVIGFGDTEGTAPRAHQSHSAFGWDAGNRAFIAAGDNEELDDVDIIEITDPRNPRLIAETGADDWPALGINGFGGEVYNHDTIVRRVEGHWLLLTSQWDAGYVVLNVDDPANPTFVKDSDYPTADPLTRFSPPEGNGHEAEWDRCPEEGVRSRFPCGNVRYILGADEDFSPYRLTTLRVTTGPNAGQYQGGEFGFTPFIATNLPGGVMQGPTVWGGSGCPDDPSTPAIEGDLNGDRIPDRNQVPPAASVPAAEGETKIVVFSRGVCFFSQKIESGQLAGYRAVAIGNSHAGAGGGATADAAFCGGQGHEYVKTASAICIGHRLMHLLFDDPPQYTGRDTQDMPAFGTLGHRIRAVPEFDGWGYLNLINADTMQHIDAYAVPESLDPRFATGFGDLTIHEITTDPTGDVGYIAWYSAGFRVVDYSGGNLREVGHYIAQEGNDIWGVELNVRRDGRLFALASDRNYGLYIFRFGTDLQIESGARRSARVGQPMRLSSVVRNDGTIAETNTRWTARLPRGMRALGASATQGRCRVSGRTITCNIGRLVENATARVSVRVRASRTGTMRATTTVSGRKAEYDVGNNSDRVSVRVRAGVAGAGAAGGALTGRRSG